MADPRTELQAMADAIKARNAQPPRPAPVGPFRPAYAPGMTYCRCRDCGEQKCVCSMEVPHV